MVDLRLTPKVYSTTAVNTCFTSHARLHDGLMTTQKACRPQTTSAHRQQVQNLSRTYVPHTSTPSRRPCLWSFPPGQVRTKTLLNCPVVSRAQAAARGEDDGDGEGDALHGGGGARRLTSLQEELGLSDAEEQVPGQPWNYQQKFDTKLFGRSSEWAPNLFALPDGVCDL